MAPKGNHVDLEPSRLDADQDWSAAVERTIAATQGGTTAALVTVLAGGPAPADLANRLVAISAIDPLVRELTTTPSGARLAGLLVATPAGRELLAALVNGSIGVELSRLLAKPDAGGPLGTLAETNADVAQVLARQLIESQPVLTEAEAILRPPPGRASAKDLLDHAAGQRAAERLGGGDAGLSLLDYLAKRPAVRHLALALIADRANHDLARSLAGCRAAHRLTSMVVEARERGPIAEALVMSRAGRAIAMSLQGTSQDRQLIHDLASDAAGQRLSVALSGATDGPFADRLEDQLAVLRLVVTISLLLILVMEPLAVAALVLVTAGVTATSQPTGGPVSEQHLDPDPGGDRNRIRLTVEVGAEATLPELGRVLYDLDTLLATSAVVQEASYGDALEIVLTVAGDVQVEAFERALERLTRPVTVEA